MMNTTFFGSRSSFLGWFWSGIVGALFWGGSLASADVAVVSGGGFGRLEVQAWTNEILLSDFPDLIFEEHPEGLPADEFDRFNLVILTGFSPEGQYSPEESQRINDWVERGGRLILIQQAPKLLNIMEGQDFADSYLYGRSHYSRDGEECFVLIESDPLIEGVVEPGDEPGWIRGIVLVSQDGWDNIIGSDRFSLVGRRPVGEGEVIYLGHELFRVLRRDDWASDDIESWKTIARSAVQGTP